MRHVLKKLIAVCLVLTAVGGCSTNAFMPDGPHAIAKGKLRHIVARSAAQTGVSPKLIAAVIRAESNGDPSAVSRAGAQGLMQLMPETSIEYGVANPFDPEQNVRGGTLYLRDLLRRYHHNVRLALAAYNAGPATVDAAHGVPPFEETRAYVARVVAYLH